MSQGDHSDLLARLSVWQGDITTLATDAIVNAANSSLLGGGGVDGAIHRAAGPQLRAFCATLGGCPAGEARLSPGFGLAARHVIHTVGPVWRGGAHGEATTLAACYRACFDIAHAQGLTTLAFPAISCGIFGFPFDAAATIAVRESMSALAARADLKVTLVAYDAAASQLYEQTIARFAT
ncbi:O-acetyl-ADP-ribose deacetylase [Niveibacterium umoris]|uniref:O-acetyl-ADP-ribose deacetylase (Regulator of RNase III) n=1 Tax=Niveibacterium umoris TaxID=1193620 RepID=A0A840BKQ1_9RHOO|nr:macro domain-containing protein [Niveibacterium umoris]MBB4012202.1 O-acetyl-ADP-ribose deacetylase (regulator of RNase III) [Niveibacterium umoris]